MYTYYILRILQFACLSLALGSYLDSGSICLLLADNQINTPPDTVADAASNFTWRLPSTPLSQPDALTWPVPAFCHRGDDDDEDQFCVFSSSSFADGRGISIITKPDRIKRLQRLPIFTSTYAWKTSSNEAGPLFEEREIPGKGRGLISARALHRGDSIITRAPIMMMDSDVFRGLEQRQWIDLEHKAVERMPQASQERLWDMDGEPVFIDPINDRMDSNAFILETDGISFISVYPEAARINHDCRPNAAYFIDPSTLLQHTYAAGDINPGTELTQSYIPLLATREVRQQKLLKSWEFSCTCSLCSLKPDLIEASDQRIQQINDLMERLKEDWEGSSFEMVKALMSLYEQERLYSRSSHVYWYAALMRCEEGFLWDAIRYAHRGIELGILEHGVNHGRVRELRVIAADPQGHPCWEKRL